MTPKWGGGMTPFGGRGWKEHSPAVRVGGWGEAGRRQAWESSRWACDARQAARATGDSGCRRDMNMKWAMIGSHASSAHGSARRTAEGRCVSMMHDGPRAGGGTGTATQGWCSNMRVQSEHLQVPMPLGMRRVGWVATSVC